jgi:hypothetical protein
MSKANLASGGTVVVKVAFFTNGTTRDNLVSFASVMEVAMAGWPWVSPTWSVKKYGDSVLGSSMLQERISERPVHWRTGRYHDRNRL